MQILSFYLPQYYPFPENDKWWGKGFTEWTNVGRAKPLFRNHYQPKVPADLGYYDLRVKEVREEQVKLAKEYGVDGFCYWHYWFGGKQLVDLVFKEVVSSGNPDFPFCLFWANHTWYAKNWNIIDSNRKHSVLIDQIYPGKEDYINHFNSLLPAFKDNRYIKRGNKPIFGIYDAISIPDFNLFTTLWNDLACQNGFEGIYFISYSSSIEKYNKIKNWKFDEFSVDVMEANLKKPIFLESLYRRILSHFNMDALLSLRLLDYRGYTKSVVDYFSKNTNVSICIIPNYDHSPRSGKNALIFTNSSPKTWKILLQKVKYILDHRNHNNNFLFIKSWNEWGEGNYLEPDLKYGRGFLEQIKSIFKDNEDS